MGDSLDCDLLLLHGLKESRLGLGRGSVDLISRRRLVNRGPD